MSSSILLRNGTVLMHDANDHVQAVKTDLLVVGAHITKIGPGLSAPDTILLDCTGKIISPGFVDTHHHLWGTQLRGRHANDLMLDFWPKGMAGFLTGSLFTERDIFWGELGGCMEAIDSGTTMVVDHANMNYSPAHSTAAISAISTSGLRAYFCYCPTPRVTSWSPFEMATSFMPDWVQSQLVELAAEQPFGDGRVQLGLAFDGYFLPKDVVVALFEQVRGPLGLKLITSHYVHTSFFGSRSVVSILNSYGLLQEDVLLSHLNGALPEDAEQIKAANAHIGCTPESEIQMAFGHPVCFRSDLHDVASLGVDCHTSNSGDMLSQMRLGLQNARGARNADFVAAGKTPRTLLSTAEDAFNLATIKGARAVGMEAEIGSIAVGKRADLVVFDAESPAMVCAGEHDPVAAIVLHASVRDIETVIVDGKIRKAGGKLAAVEVDGKLMEWKDVARELLKSRERIEEEYKQLDLETARKTALRVFGVDGSTILDHI
ncbi:hypothetical protein FB45DRAFT_992146 [Roridomyces roridus]|uniref:Amidohydrolase-related domain-containing protein n=1 Tax=Roridomyces roridus TaxID=1738132 RepID=A0AAD7BHC8_9AGAR|nr:hypothetical protein FB45DRAFT_992146 [Roridomyces roridus]